MGEVLQKYIARTGYCSRRQAEKLIKEGKVWLNGKRADLGQRVWSEDKVKVSGRRLSRDLDKVYIKLNKPPGYTCTNRSFSKEKNIFSLIKEKKRLLIAGRLDKDSRGLVFLSNDGDWVQEITHPSFAKEKEYCVKLKFGAEKEKDKIKKEFLKGIDIGRENGVVRAKNVQFAGNDNFKITLTQGKKRQIRRMFAALGLEVVD